MSDLHSRGPRLITCHSASLPGSPRRSREHARPALQNGAHAPQGDFVLIPRLPPHSHQLTTERGHECGGDF